MFDVVWDASGEKRYETGLDRGVLYPPNRRAVPWNGLVSVDEDTEDSDVEVVHFDGVKRSIQITPGDFSGSIEAYTYPDEFLEFDGMLEANGVAGLFLDNQYRSTFGLSYRTYIGNDSEGLEHGYKIHLLYNLVASPSSKSRRSISGSVDPDTFSWDISGSPIVIPGRRPTAHIIIDTRVTYPEAVSVIENILYGSETEFGRLPTADELSTLHTITVVDNGDGTATISGPDEYVYLLSAEEDSYILDIISIEFIDVDTFVISSS